MRTITRTILSILLALGLSVGVSAQARADTVEDIVQREELRVAVQTQGPPLSFVNKDGERTGFAVEISRRLAEAMGVELKLMDYEWKGLIPALLSGKVDIIAADMTPSVKRSLQISFTQPVFYEKVVAFTTKDAPYQSLSDLNQDGVTIAATQGSTHFQIAQDKLPKATVKEYAGGGPSVAQATSSGRADAGVNNAGSVRGFLREFDNLREIDGVLRRDPLAFAARPEDTHLMQVMDNFITLLKVRGELEEITQYWWESDAWREDHM